MRAKSSKTHPPITSPLSSRLTQGSIFSCAVAEDYSSCRAHGLIITAKCDAEQNKVRIYNYLPVVTLTDWLARDGKVILAERFMADILGQMRQTISENKYSPTILETETPSKVLEVLFPGGDNKAAKTRDRFTHLCKCHDVALRGLSNKPSSASCIELATCVPRLKDVLLKELVQQRLPGYYFLDRIEPQGDDVGHVVLLREVRSMTRRVADFITQGIDSNRFNELCFKEPPAETSLHVAADEIAMPISVVSSPHLEHLMQSFTLLFGRIGLPDPSSDYVSGLWDRHRIILESNK
jgi:hypothetical protein